MYDFMMVFTIKKKIYKRKTMFFDLFGTVQYRQEKMVRRIQDVKIYRLFEKKIYYTPGNPGAFGGPEKLYQAVKQGGKYKNGIRRIRQFLNNEDPYSLMKPIRRTFPRPKVVLDTIDSL